jgi:hypothetical protein
MITLPYDRDYGAYTGAIGDPRNVEPDEDELDEQTALEAAQDELAATPAVISEWLDAECTGDRDPLDVYRLAHAERNLIVPEALAVLFNAPQATAVRALYVLREAFRAAMAAGPAQERAKDLLAEQERDHDEEALQS